MASITTSVVLLRWPLVSAVLMFLASSLNIQLRKSDYAGLAAEQDQTAKLVERDIRLPNGIGVREEFSTRRRAPRKEISERNAVHPP